MMDFLRKYQSHKMVKHTQTIRGQQSTNCLSVFGHFVVLKLKGLTVITKDVLQVLNYVSGDVFMEFRQKYVSSWPTALVGHGKINQM